MKLKKIASLALAGIMAVSMLTACGDGAGSDGTTNDSSSEVVTSGTSSTFYNELTKAARNAIKSAADDADLDAALAQAVKDYVSESEMQQIASQIIGNGNYVAVNEYVSVGGANTVAVKVADKVDADLQIVNTLGSTSGNLNDKNMTAIDVYRSYFGVSDQLILDDAASDLSGYIAALPTVSADGKYEYSYVVSTSIASKTFEVAGTSVTVKYLAVQVDRTATKV